MYSSSGAVARNVLVQLGRAGDLINVLPIAQEEDRKGRRLTILVSSQFADLLDGVSYCDRIIWDGPSEFLQPAMKYARSLDPKFRVSQVWAKDIQVVRMAPSYQIDAWRKVGYGKRWEQIGLVFDRRDARREEELFRGLEPFWESGKPVVLVNLVGHSAPIHEYPGLYNDLVKELADDFTLVNIGAIRAHRLYDLLGLYDRAECLVTSDTSTLHLAQASSIPVVAFTNHRPWLGSTRRANHIVTQPYDSIFLDEVVTSVRSTQYPVGKLHHVYSAYEVKPEEKARHERVFDSWRMEKVRHSRDWVTRPVFNRDLRRTSKTDIQDDRSLPYIKDLIDKGFEWANYNDVVVLTNSDVGFRLGMTKELKRLIACKGACYCYRFDHEPRSTLVPPDEVVSGKWFGGIDLFAFSKMWWQKHRDEAPDMILGCSHWDLVYRDLIKKYGGGELYGAIWHEMHGSYWKEFPKTRGNLHNISRADQYWLKNNPTAPFTHV